MSEAAYRCASILVSRYIASGTAALSAGWVERASLPGAAVGGPGEIDVYVKSVYEPSPDEIPILDSILTALRGERIRIYEYEPLHRRGEPRHVVLGRYLARTIEHRRPAVVVMPEALASGLIGLLPGGELSGADVLRVSVEYSTSLYLPSEPPPRGLVLLAKRNSRSSYERVMWLRGVAERRGLRVAGEVYLSDNREILDYVLSGGVEERVPATKIAAYILALQDCGYTGGLEHVRRREEASHLVYAVNLPERLSERLAGLLAERRMVSLEGLARGLLGWTIVEGARRVFEDILVRLSRV